MKNLRKLLKSLKNNNFHPLNFFIPWDVKQIKPYEVMLDGTVVSFYSFFSETHENQEFLLKIMTDEKRQYNEDLIYKIDNSPNCMLEKWNSFSFTEKNGITYYYTVFKMIENTLDEFIDNRLEFSTIDETCMKKNTVNPGFLHSIKSHGMELNSLSTNPFSKDVEYIQEAEILYLWKHLIYALADLQKSRICHRDIRPSNIALVHFEESEGYENRKTDYTTNSFKNRNSNQNKEMRVSNLTSYQNNRNTGTDSNGAFSHRNKSWTRSKYSNYYDAHQKLLSNHKTMSNEKTIPKWDRSTGTYRGRSTINRLSHASISTIINRIQVKLFNFDSSEVIEHNISEQDLEFGIEMQDYPWNNDIYASQYVLDYIEANSITPNKKTNTDCFNVKKMDISGSRKGKRHK